MNAKRKPAGDGVDVGIEFACADSWLGKVLVARSRRGVCAILLGDDVRALEQELRAFHPGARDVGAGRHSSVVTEGGADRSVGSGPGVPVDDVIRWLDEPDAPFPVPLDARGTAFQQRVWQALCEIPAGATRSYGEIARALGMPRAARAVARACATNHLAIAIPCHRAVAANAALTGYRWGLERKRALLEREAEGSRSSRRPLKTTSRLAPISANTAIHIVA